MADSKTVTWAGIASTTIPELVVGQVTRQLIGAVRGTLVEVPGRAGGWHFAQKRGRRKVTAECFIQVDDMALRRAAVEAVANWFDIEVEAVLKFSDEPGVYYEATVLEAPDVVEWRHSGTFTLVWSVNPYAMDETITQETFAADADELHSWSPLLDVPVYPVIEITPTNGTLTGFTLTTNGQSLQYSGLIPDDTTLAVNSIAAVVTTGPNTDTELTGAYDTTFVSMSGVSGRFPVLLPDVVNTCRFQKLGGTATTITVTLSYRKMYRK